MKRMKLLAAMTAAVLGISAMMLPASAVSNTALYNALPAEVLENGFSDHGIMSMSDQAGYILPRTDGIRQNNENTGYGMDFIPYVPAYTEAGGNVLARFTVPENLDLDASAAALAAVMDGLFTRQAFTGTNPYSYAYTTPADNGETRIEGLMLEAIPENWAENGRYWTITGRACSQPDGGDVTLYNYYDYELMFTWIDTIFAALKDADAVTSFYSGRDMYTEKEAQAYSIPYLTRFIGEGKKPVSAAAMQAFLADKGLDCTVRNAGRLVIPNWDVTPQEQIDLMLMIWDEFGLLPNMAANDTGAPVLIPGKDLLALSGDVNDDGEADVRDAVKVKPDEVLSESALTLAKRIAAWQQTDLTNCELIPLSNDWSEFEVLTPDKPYIVGKTRYSPYCITVTPGTVLDADAVLDRYFGELVANGYPADTAEIVRKHATVTEENGVCMIRIQQSAWKNHTILDSIKSCPNVERVQAQYGYSSYDYPNTPSDFRILFTWEDENLPEFPEFDVLEIKPLDNDPTRYCMILKSVDYADSLAALKALRAIDSMDTRPALEYSTTMLADERAEARELDTELTTVFLRGDLSGDRAKNVKDAVLLARMVGGDATVSALIADVAAADIDGSGKTDAEDLTLLLRQLAKLV